MASWGGRFGIGTRSFWGDHTGPNPTDRAKNGCKRHLLTDAAGTPLVVITSPANVHDSQKALPLLDNIPPIKGPVGRPRSRPDAMLGDRAYGIPSNIRGVKERGVRSLLASPRKPHGSGLGRWRYVVERSLAWFNDFRRLRLSYERTGAHFQAFHDIAASIICARKLWPKR